MAEQAVETGLKGGVADSTVAEVFADDGAIFLLDVGVAVLMSGEGAAKVGVRPFPVEVTVDDGIEEFVAVVGVEAFGGGRLGGKIAFEGREVIGSAEIEAGTGLNPLETAVYGGRDPEEVPERLPPQRATLSAWMSPGGISCAGRSSPDSMGTRARMAFLPERLLRGLDQTGFDRSCPRMALAMVETLMRRTRSATSCGT